MKVAWNFDRGQTAVGETVPVKCTFMIEDEVGTKSVLAFVIPESAAQEMLANLAEVANPPSELTIAHSLPPNGSMT